MIWVSQPVFSQNLHLTKQQILSLFHKCRICPQDTSSGYEIMRTHVSVSPPACQTSSALLRVLKLERFQIQWDFPFSRVSSLCRAFSKTSTDQSCVFFSWWLLSQQSKLEMKKGGEEKKRDLQETFHLFNWSCAILLAGIPSRIL